MFSLFMYGSEIQIDRHEHIVLLLEYDMKSFS